MNQATRRGLLASVSIAAGMLLLIPMISVIPGSQAQAIPAWSRKYQAECTMCHSPAFARLNYFGERFQANGYQHPDAAPDGATEGKQAVGDRLALDTNIGHWFTARLNMTPIQYDTHALTVEGESKGKLTIGNANWLQLFVAGSINKNISVYIENELVGDTFHQAWYYLGFHNLGGSSWLNAQVGRLSPVVFAPYPDRLPQLPAVGGGVLRVKSSNGSGESSVDMRSPRNGIQYYGYQGPAVLYGGVTPGSKSANVGNKLGYWAGARLYLTESTSKDLAGSSVGLHFDGGTDTKDSPTTQIENAFTRIMPAVNIRYADKLDLQAAYVIASEDNQALTATAKANDYSGVRAVASYFANPNWIISTHYDNYSSDDNTLLAKSNFLFFPVLTYLPQQNFRISLYPGLDLRDVDSKLKKHTIFLNIRMAI